MMSRLIVKNLPNKISEEKLKDKFSEKGVVTDVQLKYTKSGKFRNFAFIGYTTSEEAQLAVNHFHDTYFNANKIKVELCSELGSSSKPKPWSKYARDIIAKIKQEEVGVIRQEGQIKGPRKKDLDPDLIAKLKKYKNEPEFKEFLELHGLAEKLLPIVDDSNGSEEEEEEKSFKEDSEQESRIKLADAAISDLEYLRLKSKGGTVADAKLEKAVDVPSKKYDNLFTIKVKNLPMSVKKSELKHLLKPLVPASIRRCKLNDKDSCMAYIGFKTQKEVRQALVKNKSFVGGKQILIYEHLIGSQSHQVPDRWKEQEEALKLEENIAESGKIFVRNLSYTVKEHDIEELFSKFGPVTEVIVPIDKFTRQIKGFGVVTFLMPEHAVAAYSSLDGTVFQGRMLHLLPGKTKVETEDSENKNYKDKRDKNLKETAGISYNWNTLFLGQNAVAEVVAQTYNATKQDLLTGSEAAVRLALGETQIVSQTKDFLIKQGVSLDAFNQGAKQRSKNVILVKNLPAGTTVDEIKEKFEKFGVLGRVVLPPSGITAIVEFTEPVEARAAFNKLAYSKFKHLPLYLEWAPEMTFSASSEGKDQEIQPQEGGNKSVVKKDSKNNNIGNHKEESGSEDETIEPELDTTLFVKNLNFNTDENLLKMHFESCGKIAEVTVARKKDPKNTGQMLSMGYGFIQYYLKSSLNEALIKLQGSSLDGHTLELKRSNRTYLPTVLDTRKKTNVQKQTGKKILVRNIPFQASIKEISQLFRAFGELTFVRLPKKMVGDGQHRGFAFVEYVTKHDAKQAMKALCQSTHLYGRRLVLEWAEAEEDVDDIRKRTAKNFLPSDTTKKSKKAVAGFEVTSDNEDEL